MVDNNEDVILKLEATIRSDLAEKVQVICSNRADYYLWVKFSDRFSTGYSLVDVCEVTESLESTEVDPHIYTRDCCRPWIKFQFDQLNRAPGKHTYRIRLVEIYSGDIYCLYFSYIYQENDPEKPYIYMDKNSTCCPCMNTPMNEFSDVIV